MKQQTRLHDGPSLHLYDINNGVSEGVSASKDRRQLVNEACKNIDTLQLRWLCEESIPLISLASYLPEHTEKRMKKGFVFHQYFGSVKSSNGTSIRLSYYPYTRDKKRYLNAELSIPKVVFGNNFQVEIPDIDVVSELNREFAAVFDCLALPTRDVLDAALTRIDFCQNFMVGSFVKAYIDFVRARSYSRRSRSPYQNNKSEVKKPKKVDNGVSFSTAHVRTSVYDKFEECGDIKSQGVLRLEASYRKLKAVQSITKVKAFSFAQLTPLLARDILQNELHVLELDSQIVIEKDFRRVLMEHFPYSMAVKLYDFARLDYENPGHSREGIAKIVCCSPATASNYRELLKDKGLAYAGDASANLPPLSLAQPRMDEGKGDQNLAERNSNTWKDNKALLGDFSSEFQKGTKGKKRRKSNKYTLLGSILDGSEVTNITSSSNPTRIDSDPKRNLS